MKPFAERVKFFRDQLDLLPRKGSSSVWRIDVDGKNINFHKYAEIYEVSRFKQVGIHRVAGPAYISFSRYDYIQNGLLHNTTGPARCYPDWEEYFINGVKYDFITFLLKTPATLKELRMDLRFLRIKMI